MGLFLVHFLGYSLKLIGNLVYTLLRLFQPKANIVRKTVSVK